VFRNCSPPLRRAIREEIRKKTRSSCGRLFQVLLFINGELRMTINRTIGKVLFRAVHAKFGVSLRLFASGGARLEPEVFSDLSNFGFTIDRRLRADRNITGVHVQSAFPAKARFDRDSAPWCRGQHRES